MGADISLPSSSVNCLFSRDAFLLYNRMMPMKQHRTTAPSGTPTYIPTFPPVVSRIDDEAEEEAEAEVEG